MTEEYLDAKAIVRHVSRLPGIASCLLMFTDGLPIAGNLPDGMDNEAFSALVPRFITRVHEATTQLRLGETESITVHTSETPVSFFMHNGVAMALIHNRSRFMPGVREKLVAIMREVSLMFATPTH